MTPRLRCPECGSHDVVCVPHPTAARWHEYECQDCGYTGGEHKGSVASTSPSRWRAWRVYCRVVQYHDFKWGIELSSDGVPDLQLNNEYDTLDEARNAAEALCHSIANVMTMFDGGETTVTEIPVQAQ